MCSIYRYLTFFSLDVNTVQYLYFACQSKGEYTRCVGSRKSKSRGLRERKWFYGGACICHHDKEF